MELSKSRVNKAGEYLRAVVARDVKTEMGRLEDPLFDDVNRPGWGLGARRLGRPDPLARPPPETELANLQRACDLCQEGIDDRVCDVSCDWTAREKRSELGEPVLDPEQCRSTALVPVVIIDARRPVPDPVTVPPLANAKERHRFRANP